MPGDDFTPQDDFTPIQKQQAPDPRLSGMNQVTNKTIDFLRPLLANAGGLAAAGGASLIPGVGESGIAQLGAETQGYTLVDQLLQRLKPSNQSIPGRPNIPTNESFGKSEGDALINAVSGRILSGLFRGVNSFRNSNVPDIYNYLPTSSQVLEANGYHKLATLSKFAEDLGASGAKAEALDKAGGAGFTQALRLTNLMNGRAAGTNINPQKLGDTIKLSLQDMTEPISQDIPYKSWSKSFSNSAAGQTPLTVNQEAYDLFRNGGNTFKVLDDAIANPDKLQKILTAGQFNGQVGLNVKQDLQAYQFMRMVQDSVSSRNAGGDVLRLDPDKLNKMWNNPELQQSFDLLYGKQGKQNITDFLKNVTATQDKQASIGGYFKNRALWAASGGFVLSAGLFAGHLTGEASTLGSLVGLYVPFNAIGRLLTKPATGRALVAMAGGESADQSAKITGRLIVDALQGSTIALVDGKGKKQYGQIVKDPKTGTMKFEAAGQ